VEVGLNGADGDTAVAGEPEVVMVVTVATGLMSNASGWIVAM
jgi:hypothetical protein